jgi:hypothetical protein
MSSYYIASNAPSLQHRSRGPEQPLATVTITYDNEVEWSQRPDVIRIEKAYDDGVRYIDGEGQRDS